jgi:hypothetical protein
MQTNNVFSAGRFGGYMRKHLVDNFRLYGLSAIVLSVLLLFMLIISMSYNMRTTPVLSALVPVFFIGMFVTGLIFTSLCFSELGNKPQGIDYLLFPASQLEKFVSTLFVSTLGFLLIYHIAFYLAYLGMDAVVLMRRGVHIVNDLNAYLRDEPWLYTYYGWFIAQAIMLLGAAYFQKYSFIKTIFALILFIASLYFVNTLFAYLFFGQRLAEWNHHFPFVGINVVLGNIPSEGTHAAHKFLMLPSSLRDGLLFIAKYLLAPMLWALAYMRLRDKEM